MKSRLPFSIGRRIRLALLLVIVTWSLAEVLRVKSTLIRHQRPPGTDWGRSSHAEKVYIAAIHWNNEKILREIWIPALMDLVTTIGRDNVFVSVQESGSWDDSKGALRLLDRKLAENDIPRRIILDETTHKEEISSPPPVAGNGWIKAPTGMIERRRIPYLADLRNLVLQPLYERRVNASTVYDKILFLGDVAFTTPDILRLLSTREGNYAAACSLDFSKPPSFYDTFALRDSENHQAIMQTWPYFRSHVSRTALKKSQPIPVKSCWNGIVSMDSTPFYTSPSPLFFRGISDSLAESHLEASECCLIHADNPLSERLGVWLNPDVRVGYDGAAYATVNPDGEVWLSMFDLILGTWKNRILRWLTTSWFTERLVKGRMAGWEAQDSERSEVGSFCVVNEMQVLVENGWAHR